LIAAMPEAMRPEVGGENQELRDSLTELIPGVQDLEADDFKTLAGLMRRQVLLEQQEEVTSQNIVAASNWQEIQRLISGLPLNNLREMAGLIDELALDPEESENETLNWAFRHQSLGGDLLVGEDLIPFKLIRLKEYSYILLCRDHRLEVLLGFSKAFQREPAVTTDKALKVEGHTWVGYAWFLDPDAQAAQNEADNLRAIWEGVGA
jgi:hypothetical protein